jgi:hypothetical protein
LFQTPLGAPRKLIVVLGDPKYHLLGFFVGYLLGVNARFLGALSPVFRIVGIFAMTAPYSGTGAVIRAVADKPN